MTRDPESRTTQSGKTACTFTVAVNRKGKQENDADFFRVTAWDKTGEICKQYLAKGRKVCVIGPVSVSTYTAQDGSTRANMEVTAQDVEFLTPRGQQEAGAPKAQEQPKAQQDTEEEYQLPF